MTEYPPEEINEPDIFDLADEAHDHWNDEHFNLTEYE